MKINSGVINVRDHFFVVPKEVKGNKINKTSMFGHDVKEGEYVRREGVYCSRSEGISCSAGIPVKSK